MGLSAGTGVSSAPDTAVAVKEAVSAARAKLPEGSAPTIAFVNATVDRDIAKFSECLTEELKGVPLHGQTSCGSILEGANVVPNGVGVLLLAADKGALVSAAQPANDSVSPFESGQKAAQGLVDQVGSAADVKHVLFAATPGIEDEVMKGVESVLGSTPVFGGSAADNTIEGNWNLVTSSAGVLPSGVSLVGVTGNVSFGASLVSPYTPSDRVAKLTGAEAKVGQTLTVMNKDGGKDSVLAASLGLERAYETAKTNGGINEPAAGLFIYCGGLSFAVGDRFQESLAPLKDKAPLIGSTVFGEQGSFEGCNLHCNLAVGVALFE